MYKSTKGTSWISTLLFNKYAKMKFAVKRLKQWKLDIQNANFIILIFFVHKFVFLSFTTRISQWIPTPMKSIKLQIYQFRLSFNTYNPLHTLIYLQLKNEFVSIVNDTEITWKTQTSISDAIKHKTQSLWKGPLVSYKWYSK